MERWRAPTVLAWLEIALGMPQYGPRCAENVKSGKVSTNAKTDCYLEDPVCLWTEAVSFISGFEVSTAPKIMKVLLCEV
jgi:hypothetical protein